MKSYWPPPKAADNWSLLQPMSARRATSSSPAAMRARRLLSLVTSVLSFSSSAGSVPGRSAEYILLATWPRRHRSAVSSPTPIARTENAPNTHHDDQGRAVDHPYPLPPLQGARLG